MIARVVLRSATARSGVQCAMISGAHLTLEWHAPSWDTPVPVRTTIRQSRLYHDMHLCT